MQNIESFQAAPEAWRVVRSADQFGGQLTSPLPGWLTVSGDDGTTAVVPADYSDGRLVPAAELPGFLGVLAPGQSELR